MTGRLERGTIKKGSDCEFIGYNKTIKSTITGKLTFILLTAWPKEHEGSMPHS